MAEEKNENKLEKENKEKLKAEIKEENKKETSEKTKEKKPEEKKKKIGDFQVSQSKKKEVPKKTEAVVNANSLPMSTKTAGAICRFIKGKEIQRAISDLEEVIAKRKAVPMKGEIPHRKGNIMSGRYPKNASEIFIKLLKSLNSNANYLSVENPIISEAIPNNAPRPYGKFGAVRKKRTHMTIKAIPKKKTEEKKK
ncbi:hypothetical protein HY449_03085 [Candidatus Pacearchaeota archaeon]|nr:hypothetical protein [Candidatus Pacearchaeota archaeon]